MRPETSSTAGKLRFPSIPAGIGRVCGPFHRVVIPANCREPALELPGNLVAARRIEERAVAVRHRRETRGRLEVDDWQRRGLSRFGPGKRLKFPSKPPLR
jgi:hypothetical protein